ncbi:MAG: hypothetical protein A2648_02655 [Candidatus Lloydbacteria bacterium RIFCSPHIGHO2_01_FULL_41_20]|uniref:FecR protein domain-containing protein n=1 Tax=Candidatus Lloydbacteria bacterium RIFCSPHIGHO2_01_FULL_41_20 TaxID=1798657 RepID=A0A1G2CSW3_9BACT|nr:MAG: hypothetical protein A2648_02655 [Candidatus Lloydbacteria bacterium RIFCSPHIGHO2_01_FULL_41_20]
MSLQKIGLIVGGLVLVLGGGYYVVKNLSSVKKQFIPEAQAASLWIEVISSSISFIDKNGLSQPLHSGDEVSPGTTIVSNATGRAVIHLPDGSVLRVDENSKLILDNAEFSSTDDGLIVEATLVFGRVWSKVVGLATPESRWEVKTSNAVATVRGTSFGVGYKDGKSRIVGGENKIKVNPIDPKTQKVIDKAEREIDSGKFIEIKDEDIDTILSKPESLSQPLAIAKAPKDVLDWNLRNEIADRVINQKIEILKQGKLNDRVIRNILRKETETLKEKVKSLKLQEATDEEIDKEIRKEGIKEFKDRLRINIEKLISEGVIDNTTYTETTNETSTENIDNKVSSGETIIPIGQPVKLEVTGITAIKEIKDTDKISIKVLLLFSSGDKKDVTETAVWKITGNIGTVERGIFMAKIREEDSEIGEIKGSLQATFQDGDISLTSDVINIIVFPQVGETIPQG